jgi:molybdenum cofactor cytidylyltransferase
MQFSAVIPAAGSSVRMECEKLLLPWGEATLIEATLGAWRRSRVERMVVTVREEQAELTRTCLRAGAQVALAATLPRDMKASALIALDYVRAHFTPQDDDAWLLAPADMPLLSVAVIDSLCRSHDERIALGKARSILVPVAAGRRGHPVLFPWPLALDAARLGDGEGLDRLTERCGAESIDVTSLANVENTFIDIDTREEYERLSIP